MHLDVAGMCVTGQERTVGDAMYLCNKLGKHHSHHCNDQHPQNPYRHGEMNPAKIKYISVLLISGTQITNVGESR